MCLRWTAAGMLEAETRFRKVEGYRGLANLAVAIEQRPPPSVVKVSLTPHPRRTHHNTHCVTIHNRTVVTTNFYGERDNLLREDAVLAPEEQAGAPRRPAFRLQRDDETAGAVDDESDRVAARSCCSAVKLLHRCGLTQ